MRIEHIRQVITNKIYSIPRVSKPRRERSAFTFVQNKTPKTSIDQDLLISNNLLLQTTVMYVKNSWLLLLGGYSGRRVKGQIRVKIRAIVGTLPRMTTPIRTSPPTQGHKK